MFSSEFDMHIVPVTFSFLVEVEALMADDKKILTPSSSVTLGSSKLCKQMADCGCFSATKLGSMRRSDKSLVQKLARSPSAFKECNRY